jgi:hypothetical protein
MDSVFAAFDGVDGFVAAFDEMLLVLGAITLIHVAYKKGKQKSRAGTDQAPVPETEQCRRQQECRTYLQAKKPLEKKAEAVVEIVTQFEPLIEEKAESVAFDPRISSIESLLSDASTADSDSELQVQIRRKSALRKSLTRSDSSCSEKSSESESYCFARKKSTRRVRFEDDNTKPVLQNAANANVQKFLSESAHYKVKPEHLAQQVHLMLESSNIELSSETYQMLLSLCIQGGSLKAATEISIQMEKKLGTALPQDLQSQMLDLYFSVEVQEQTDADRVADASKMELVAELTKNPWYGWHNGLQQKHQIFTSQNRFLCLSMSGEAQVFKVYDLFWGGADGNTLHWGKMPGTTDYWGRNCCEITLGCTAEQLKTGELFWAKKGGSGYNCQWKWSTKKPDQDGEAQ